MISILFTILTLTLLFVYLLAEQEDFYKRQEARWRMTHLDDFDTNNKLRAEVNQLTRYIEELEEKVEELGGSV